MNYVGFGRRFVAALLDFLITWAISFVINLVLVIPMAGAGGESGVVAFMGLSQLLGLVLFVLYWIVLQSKMGGQTLGKKVMGIKVVTDKGGVPSMLTLVLREVVGKLVSMIIIFIGYLMVLWDGKKQGLHDKIASTYVVKA